MKLANRIFLFFSALSVISFVQFDAIAVNDCSVAPKAGKYCQKPNNKPDCPKGCWCEGQSTYHLEGRVSQDRVAEICRNKDATVPELRQLHYAKVYVCGIDYNSIPYGEQDPHGFAGTGITGTTVLESYSDLKTESKQGCKANGAPGNSGSGFFYDGGVGKSCPSGCFCSGSTVRVDLDYTKVQDACILRSSDKINGFDIKTYLEERGVNYCPQGYTYALPGAKVITECKKANGQEYVAPISSGTSEFTERVNGSGLTVVSSDNGAAYRCDPGQYLPNNETGSPYKFTCTDCPAGWYCPGDNKKYQCTGTRKYSMAGKSTCSTCPAGRQANSTHTGCEAMTINMGTTNVAAQRVDVSDLVPFDPTCLNGDPSHKVYFLRGAGDATGTMNPVNKCTGDTVTLPSSSFTRAGYQFDKWNCDNNNIGTKAAGATFTMPNVDVNCTAQWTVDTGGSTGNGTGEDTGGGTGGSTGGGTGGSTGGGTGGSAGDGTGGSTGGGTGGSAGDGTGGSTGGGTGGSTGGGTGGSTGGGTGGSAGDDPETPVSCTTAGKYWNGDGCITCESGYFCPGNGQHYKCPFGGASTQNKASCVLNLNETQMEYNKCWLRYWNNAAAYRKCLYGIDLATLPH